MNRVALLAAVGAALAAPAPRPFTYRFEEVKSRVYRSPDGDEKRERRVAAGDAADPGDLVRTGFWARTVLLVPERKSRFEIDSSTRARLARDEPGVLLALERGRLKAFFEALTGDDLEERRVAAPGALLAVRGTRYGLEVDAKGQCLLAVFEGTVEVIPAAPGVPPVSVHANELCTFSPRTAPQSMPMKLMGMSEGSWGLHHGVGGMSQGSDGRMPGTGQSGMPQQPGGSMHGGSPMGPPKGH